MKKLAIIDDMKDNLAREFWNRVDLMLGTETLKDLCKKAGLNYDSIRNRKSGATYSLPRMETGYALSRALGVSMEFLLTGKDDRPASVAELVYEYMNENMPGTLDDILNIIQKKTGNSGTKVS